MIDLNEKTEPADSEASIIESMYILRCIRYHTRRTSLFGLLNRTSSFISVFFGSSAAASFLYSGNPRLAGSFALIVTFFSALDLVIGTASKEAQHSNLRRSWVMLKNTLEEKGIVNEYLNQKRAIEAEEPPELSVVNLQSHNDVLLAMYGEDARDELFVIPWRMQFFGSFINLDTSKVKPAKEHNEINKKAKKTNK